MILNIGELINNRRSNRKIDVISNNSASIEDAKAKVQAIIDSGAKKRKKLKKKRRKKDEEN